MKRILIATALTASMATAGFAATEQETAEIHTFLPTLNVEALSDVDVANALQIINGGDSRADKIGKLQAIVAGIDYSPTAAMGSEAEMAQLQAVAPEADLSMLTQAQLDTALLLLNSTDGGEAEEKVRAVLMDDGMAINDMNGATEAEMIILERYLSAEEIAALSEPQLNTALAIVYGGGSQGDIEGKLNGLVN